MIWMDEALALVPVEIIFRTGYEQQRAQTKFQLDLKLNPTTPQALDSLCSLMWSALIAPLTVSGARLIAAQISPFKLGGPIHLYAPPADVGLVLGPPADVSSSAVVLSWNGASGGEGTRRHYFPFMPAYSQAGRVIGKLGLSLLQTSMRAMILGCDGDIGGLGPRLIHWRGPRAASAGQPARPAQFADVRQLIACAYTDRAPDAF